MPLHGAAAEPVRALLVDARERGAAAAIDWAFDTLGWDDIIHCISPANLASKKVAQRLGSTLLREGRLLPPPSDEVDVELWGQSRPQWREHRRRLA